jgi:NMD protein affecting ribosome stability and mRNA decay
MIKYCPTCERTSNDTPFIGEFCKFCITARASKDFPGRGAAIEYCKRCGRIKTNEGYVEFTKKSLGTVLAKILYNSKCKIDVKDYNEKEARASVTVPIDEDYKVSFEKVIPLKSSHAICQDCFRKSSGYYEEVFQIRGEKEKVNMMKEKVKRFLETRGAFIAKIDEHDTGVDMYISSKGAMKTFFFYNKLKPKASYTLYSIRQGKKIYRDTHMLRI